MSAIIFDIFVLQISFSSAVRSKARQSIRGKPDEEGPQAHAVEPPDVPPNMSMSTVSTNIQQ